MQKKKKKQQVTKLHYNRNQLFHIAQKCNLSWLFRLPENHFCLTVLCSGGNCVRRNLTSLRLLNAVSSRFA
ncbi:MAG: hypothetical protein J6W29_07370 [Neisseriaceae bacterium]|nr:hypothetical protein [Neisseriaceae bacterium]